MQWMVPHHSIGILRMTRETLRSRWRLCGERTRKCDVVQGNLIQMIICTWCCGHILVKYHSITCNAYFGRIQWHMASHDCITNLTKGAAQTVEDFFRDLDQFCAREMQSKLVPLMVQLLWGLAIRTINTIISRQK